MQKTNLFNILILIIALIFSIIIIEISLQIIIGPEKIIGENGENIALPDEKLGFSLKPNFKGRFREIDFDTSFNTNSQGYRGGEFNKSDKNVIFMLGDSFTIGHGVEQNETSSYYIQNILNNTYKTYNLGVMRYSQKQHIVQLKNLSPMYKPKVIIDNFYVGNDIIDNCEPMQIINIKESNSKRIKNLIKKSKLAVLIYRTIILPRKEPIELDFYIQSNNNEKCYEFTKEYLKEMKNISNESNASLVIVIIGREVQTSERERKKLLKWYERFNKYNLNKDKFDINIMNKKVLEMCSQLNLKCIDLTPIFTEKSERLYVKDGHWNKNGHILAAENIVKYLKENILV